MLVMRTTKDPTYPICKLVSAKHSLGLHHFVLAVYPFGFYGVQPRTLGGRKQVTIRTPRLFSLTWRLWALIQPLTSRLLCQLALSQIRSRAFLPLLWSLWQHHPRNCVVMALSGRPSTNQPRLFKLRQIKPVAGEGFGVWIVLCGLLVEEAHRLARLLPGMHRGSLKAAEPTLVLETQNPLRMGLGEPDQPISIPFFLS